MNKHPHHTRYAQLIAGFAAASFAVLITTTMHYAEMRAPSGAKASFAQAAQCIGGPCI